MTKIKLVVFGALLLLLLTGCSLLALKPPKGLNAQQGRGWETFTRRCAACHKVKGKGGGSAVDLTHVAGRRDRKYLNSLLHDPKSVMPNTKMPPTTLSDAKIEDVLSYLMTLK